MKMQYTYRFYLSPGAGDFIEERLWDYIDGRSSDDEKKEIEQLLDTQVLWKNKYRELTDVHALLHSNLALEQPSMRFTQNVMEQIAQYQIAPATKNYINKNIIYGIAAFFLTLIAGFLAYGISQVNWSQGNGSQWEGFRWESIDFSKVFNNTYINIFMMVNIVAGLMLFDRYLASRKNEGLQKRKVL